MHPKRLRFNFLGDLWFQVRQRDDFIDSRRRQNLTACRVGNLMGQCQIATRVQQLQRQVRANGEAGSCGLLLFFIREQARNNLTGRFDAIDAWFGLIEFTAILSRNLVVLRIISSYPCQSNS